MAETVLYRIGEFAKKLGVTPDMLKYCEKKGLIHSVKEANGYRYYDFRQSASVIEYLKLQNLGFSADEALHALHAEDFDELVALEQERSAELKRQVCFAQAMLDRNRYLEQVRGFFQRPDNWTLQFLPPAWFLPHTQNHIFTEDEAVLRMIEQWNTCLPVVESCSRHAEDEADPGKYEHGYYVRQDLARELGLEVTPPVVEVPGGLYLEIYRSRSIGGSAPPPHVAATELLEQLQLRQCGDAYMVVLAKMWHGNGRHAYGVLRIPVEHC